jgi:hypothetical protein
LFGSNDEVEFAIVRRKSVDHPRSDPQPGTPISARRPFTETREPRSSSPLPVAFVSAKSGRRNWASSTNRRQEAARRHHLALLQGLGQKKTVDHARQAQGTLGFREATRSGTSIGIDDMIIPKEKKEDRQGLREDRKVEKQYRKRCHHRRRALQQDRRHLDPCDRQIANALFARRSKHNDGKKESTRSS